MGNCCLPIQFRRRASAINPKKVTLLLVGLDNAGKTTIAKRLTEEPIDTVVPTVGFSLISLQQKGCQVSIYDLGGGPQIRDIWARYYADAHGVIFVVDANDTRRMEECRTVLEDLLQHREISGKPVLLLANKQDLDGALDEIDVVDRLNVERLVNEQKCPTLVELCSASHFSKKMDIGIENGYKWLIRCIVKDYPTLNNRVLQDLAKQQEEDRIHLAKRKARIEQMREERGIIEIDLHENHKDFGDPFKPIKNVLEEKPYRNGIVKHIESMDRFQKEMANIPGLIEDASDEPPKTKTTRRFIEKEQGSPADRLSFSSQFFKQERIESEAELLNNVGVTQESKNFLVRPKSSGARLYGSKSDSELKHLKKKRKFKKSNKTGPSPFTDLSTEQNSQLPKVFDPAYHMDVVLMKNGEGNENKNSSTDNLIDERDETSEDISDVITSGKNPFIVKHERRISISETSTMNLYKINSTPSSKSMPTSRKSSAKVIAGRRNSMFTEGFSKVAKLPPLNFNIRMPPNSGVLLDVTQLEDS